MILQHATLGASSSERWLNCSGSVALAEGMPNESSVYAREGTVAHHIGEQCLLNNQEALDYLDFELAGYDDIEVDEEMCESVQIYLDTVRAMLAEYEACGYDDAELGVEVRFDLRHIFHDMFGTCDAVIYFPQWKKLVVFDYKHGYVNVAVEFNKQTMYYGVGALTGKHNRAIATVELVIVQPNSWHHKGAVKRWECDPIELLDFIGDLIEGAKKTELPDAPFKAGYWCRYCPAAPVCRALEKLVETLAQADFTIDGEIIVPQPKNMTLNDLKLAWENAGIIEAWVKSVKGYAHSQAIAGHLLPGTKLVAGRFRRRWKSADRAQEKLEQLQAVGYIAADVEIVEKKVISPAKAEAKLKKHEHALIEDLWEKGQGGLSLVPESDDRPSAKVDALDEFS